MKCRFLQAHLAVPFPSIWLCTKGQYCELKAKGGGRKDRKFQVWHNVRKKKEGTFSCTDYGKWMSMTRYVNRSAQVY